MIKWLLGFFKSPPRSPINPPAPDMPAMKRDARGHFAPVDSISQLELGIDARVSEIGALHVDLAAHVQRVKERTSALVEECLFMLNIDRPTSILYSYDQSIRLEVDTYRHKQFNSQLATAHGLMLQAITRWAKHSTGNGHPQLVALAEQRVDFERMTVNEKQRLLDLLRIEAPNDPDWVAAQTAIKSCFDVLWSKRRVRVYLRQDNGRYKLAPVNYNDNGKSRNETKSKSHPKPKAAARKKPDASMGLFH